MVNDQDIQELGISIRIGEAGARTLLKTSSKRDEEMLMRGVLLGALLHPDGINDKLPGHLFNARAAIGAALVFNALRESGNPAPSGKASQVPPEIIEKFADMIRDLDKRLTNDLMNPATEHEFVRELRGLIEALINQGD